MRRFSVAPGESITIENFFDEDSVLTINGHDSVGREKWIIMFVKTKELLRLAEACRQAYFDAARREDAQDSGI